jgi:hypothetical protein
MLTCFSMLVATSRTQRLHTYTISRYFMEKPAEEGFPHKYNHRLSCSTTTD